MPERIGWARLADLVRLKHTEKVTDMKEDIDTLLTFVRDPAHCRLDARVSDVRFLAGWSVFGCTVDVLHRNISGPQGRLRRCNKQDPYANVTPTG